MAKVDTIGELIIVSDDDDDELIIVSDDASVEGDDTDDDVSVEDDDMEEDDMEEEEVEEEEVESFVMEIGTAGRTQHFSLPNGRDFPGCLQFAERIDTASSLLSSPRESLHTVAAQAHWDAAFLAHLLLDMPVPNSATNMHIFLEGSAGLRERENPHFTITLE